MAAVTFKAHEVLALYLSSFKLTPEMNSNSKRNFLLLTSAHAFPSESCISSRCLSRWIYIRFSVFFCFLFSQTCPDTSKQRLNFMLVTELKHCENNSFSPAKYQGTGFFFYISNVYSSLASSRKRPFNPYISYSHLSDHQFSLSGYLQFRLLF